MARIEYNIVQSWPLGSSLQYEIAASFRILDIVVVVFRADFVEKIDARIFVVRILSLGVLLLLL